MGLAREFHRLGAVEWKGGAAAQDDDQRRYLVPRRGKFEGMVYQFRLTFGLCFD